ncbi:MAG: hypothetical protein J0M18_13845 [Ignavibacteria bacterium]|nr:hypothetical protein [Ignavibacteria bacterium]
MKKTFLLFFCLTPVLIFYFNSCSDSVITPVKGEYTQWEKVDSTSTGEYISMISQDENNYAYYITHLGLYTANRNYKKKYSISDNSFRAELVNTYSANYTVVYGLADNFKYKLYIFDGENSNEITLDSINLFSSMEMVVVQPGKIFASLGGRIYKYDNGVITKDSIPYYSVTSFANTPSGLYAFSDYISGCNTYVYDGSHFKFHSEQVRQGENVPLGNSLARITSPQTNVFALSYYTNKWDFITNISAYIILTISGADKNYFYTTIVDTNYNKAGFIWNGTAFVKDENFPLGPHNWPVGEVSQMKNSVFYYTESFSGKSYLYKVSRVPVY